MLIDPVHRGLHQRLHQLTTIVDTLAHREFALYPSLAFAAVAFLMVLLAKTPNPDRQTRPPTSSSPLVHEALILEYSARHLALIEWAVAISCSPT